MRAPPFPQLRITSPSHHQTSHQRLSCPSATANLKPQCGTEEGKLENQEEHNVRIKKLKEYARQLILEKNETVKKLELVDTLEQLGVAYHFEAEIIDVLENNQSSIYEATPKAIMRVMGVKELALPRNQG